ncbi:hypothetical protein ACFO0A_14695 [Novosphingobium tardum]|uniref:Copper resistance protein D domain-containing protein n=1 Tax=Novosphingobium tardum TaxID=1538021 RepID=A0ABV8RT11_9SPHN
MDDFEIARSLHVLAVVMWIGGVAFVTTVIFPAVRRSNEAHDQLSAFEAIERNFAPQARVWVLVAGLTGFWMVYRANLWTWFLAPHNWWLQAMLGLWLIFATMLFILEPLVIHRRMKASTRPEADFNRLERMHRVLFVIGLIVIVGGVGGVHGLF